jgi:dienelactone hydrolase
MDLFAMKETQLIGDLTRRETANHTAPSREFSVHVDGRTVPVIVWTPTNARGRRPLVLVGHGGSGHKTSQLVLDIMRPLVTQHGLVVAAIDGPVHGARRKVFDAGATVRQEFRDLWARGGSIAPMVADWRATIDALGELPEVDADAIGWYGISMGTAYGLPLVAAEPRIHAAVLGMWGTCRAGSEQLAFDAANVHVPVLFQQKADDEFFTGAGQVDLYERLASSDKRLWVYPGRHTDPAGEQLDDAIGFLRAHLTRSHHPLA